MAKTKNEPKRKQDLLKIAHIHQLIVEKRNEDLLRFRTCCADPRASK